MTHFQFCKVHAWLEGKRLMFDPSRKACNYGELKAIPKPHWALAFAGYVFDYEDIRCVALVQRVKNSKPDKWALIPAGVSDNLYEIKYPEKLLERETDEELIVCERNIRVDLQKSKLLTTSQVEIVDATTNTKYHARGELYPDEFGENIFLAQAYYFKENMNHATFFDGEQDPCGRQLDRKIALVDINNLDGPNVEPLAIFKRKNRLGKCQIDLTEINSAPSLRWFRKSLKVPEPWGMENLKITRVTQGF